MTKKRTALWWSYVVSGVVLLFFLAPSLISAADTVLVLAGVALVISYGVWTWMLWGKSLAANIAKDLEQ